MGPDGRYPGGAGLTAPRGCPLPVLEVVDMSVPRVASSCRRDRGEGSSWALARSARARRRGSGPSTPSSSPTWSIARGWGTTCVNGRRSCAPRSGWSGWASAWTGSARCTAPGWCCAPTSCGRRIPTTTPSAPGPACAGSTPWCGSPTASRPTRPRRPNSRSTGGGCTGSSSTSPAALRTSWSNRSSGSTAYLYGEPEEAVRPAAVHRAKAMELSDQWVADGCQPDSDLLPLEHAALVRAYAALLAAVHH